MLSIVTILPQGQCVCADWTCCMSPIGLVAQMGGMKWMLIKLSPSLWCHITHRTFDVLLMLPVRETNGTLACVSIYSMHDILGSVMAVKGKEGAHGLTLSLA
jgi:hypothetical protein